MYINVVPRNVRYIYNCEPCRYKHRQIYEYVSKTRQKQAHDVIIILTRWLFCDTGTNRLIKI